jgi:hypothetical protein
VLLQLLPMAVLLLACLGLRRRSPRLRHLPWGIPFLPGLALLGWVLALAGQRWGLRSWCWPGWVCACSNPRSWVGCCRRSSTACW